MNKRKIQNILDAGALLALCLIIATGVVIRYSFPPGMGRLIGKANVLSVPILWGLTTYHWQQLHFWASVLFLFSIVPNVVLEYPWIKAFLAGTSRDVGSGRRAGMGIIGLVTLITILFAWSLNTWRF